MTLSFSVHRKRAAFLRLCRRFRRGRSGIAAVEFAVVVPIMLTIYFGVVEVGQGVMIDRKVTQLNRALADLAAQAVSISNAERDNIFNAALTVMQPFTNTAPGMSFGSIVVDNAGVARVCWGEGRNAVAPVRGATVTLPVDLRVPNSSLIVARASYNFTPAVGYVISGTLNIGNVDIYMRPRIGKIGGVGSVEQVERVGVAMCP